MQLNRIIETLYEGTLDTEAWERAVLAIADSVRASAAVLFAFNPQTGAVLRNENFRFDPEVIADYARYWTFEDIRRNYALELPTGIPGTEKTLKIPLLGTPIYHEFMLPVDSPHFMPVWLLKTPTRAVALSLQGTRRRGPFEAADVARYRSIVPHLARSMQIKDRLEAASLRATARTSGRSCSMRGAGSWT